MKIVNIIGDQNKVADPNRMNWKVVLADNGSWGYTTSDADFLKIGNHVVFETRDTDYSFYVDLKGTKLLNQ